MSRLTGFSPKVRHLIKERAQGCCERCGAKTTLGQAHHRRPRGSGGSRRPDTNLASNALWLCSAMEKMPCRGCHDWIETYRAEAMQKGWIVRQGRSPAEIPVLRMGEWVLLDDQGGFLPIPEPAGGRVA